METQVKVKKKYPRVSKKKAAQAVSKWYETFPAARTILRQNRNGITITQSRNVPIDYSELEQKIITQNDGKIPSGDLYTEIMNAVGNITRNEVKSVAMMFLYSPNIKNEYTMNQLKQTIIDHILFIRSIEVHDPKSKLDVKA